MIPNHAWTRTLTFLIALLLAMGAAFAEDVVEMNNGRTYEGRIVNQTDDYVEIVVQMGTIESSYYLMTDNIALIKRDGEVVFPPEAVEAAAENESANAARTEAAATGARNASPESSAREDDKPLDLESTINKRVFVIPMEGMVGKFFRQDKLEEAIEAGKQYDPDVIVLLINSPGGLLTEVYKLRDYLQKERNEERIVVWIKSAISAAAMTAFNVREMYFMKEGHIGAATAFRGTESLQGEELERWLEAARAMFASAKWDPKIAQAMIDEKYWLSADVEIRPTGEREVTWRDDGEGDVVLSRPGENLVIDAEQAYELGIASAICDNEEELAEALNLEGWVEVSSEGRDIMESWKNTLERADKEIPKLLMRYEALQGMGIDPCVVLKQQVQILRDLINWSKRMPDQVGAIFYGLDQNALERELRLAVAQLKRDC